MDKIAKSLNRLNSKEKVIVKNILLKIKNGHLDHLDVKKLKGRNDIFRVRKGKIRIIYRLDRKGNNIYILDTHNAILSA